MKCVARLRYSKFHFSTTILHFLESFHAMNVTILETGDSFPNMKPFKTIFARKLQIDVFYIIFKVKDYFTRRFMCKYINLINTRGQVEKF